MKKYILAFLTILLFSSSHAQTVSILYFNDAHEIAPVIDDYGERGGFARLKTIIDSVKVENPQTIVVFGGDCAGGTLFGAFYHGYPQIEAFNTIPVDIASFGQHDFDFGVENNLKLIEKSRFDWITSNLVYNDGTPYAGLAQYKIVSIAGMKIGFLGLTDAMGTTIRTKNIHQIELLLAAENTVNVMNNESPDCIIAITQTDLETNKNLLMNIPAIDAILTEECSETVTEISYVGDRPIISPCGNIGSIARLDIRKESDQFTSFVTAYPTDNSIEPNPEMLALENKYQQELEERLSEEPTYLKSPLIAGITTDHASRWKETNVGNFLTDSFRAYFEADIAVLNGGGIRADAQEGPLTTKDALALIPFGNHICLVEVPGENVMALLEHGTSAVEEKAGRFLQISGASYSYNPQKEPYNRILQVTVGTEQLDRNKMYKVALPDYILNGGDGFHVGDDVNVLVPPDTAPKDIEVFIQYLKQKESLDPQIENRITVVENEE